MPRRRNTWFTVSATECPASANIAALPVSAPATSLPQAIARFAAIAARTAPRLSSPGLSMALEACVAASAIAGTNANMSAEQGTSERPSWDAGALSGERLGAGQPLGRAQREQVGAELVVALPLEVPVVYRQVAELAEVADNMPQRLVRVERETLLAVAAAIGLFRLCHIYPSE